MKISYKNEVSAESFDIYNFKAWESNALPLGNGHFGIAELGSVNKERLQVTENSLANPYHKSLDEEHKSNNYGVISFCDIYLYFKHQNYSGFKRELSLDKSLLTIRYESEGVKYKREMFVSYPDDVLVMRISASSPFSFSGRLSVPFLGDYCRVPGDGFSRSVKYYSDDNVISFSGNLSYYNIDYVGAMRISIKGGELSIQGNNFEIKNTKEAILIFSCSTNYKLSEKVFLSNDPKTKLEKDPNLYKKLINTVNTASNHSFKTLFKRHFIDYSSLYSRVEINIGRKSKLSTDELIKRYREGHYSTYLEMLLYQFGRYLLICSSRKGYLPANLQGIWSAYDSSPWSAGYWHNINVQMNYWLVGPSNLLECFIPYIEYALSYLPLARKHADEYVLNNDRTKYAEGNNGWIIGTAAWPYDISGINNITHSGPGTGAFTSLLFYEYYAFSQDKTFLKETAYPFLYEMSIFLHKCLDEVGDLYLVQKSSSPENIITGGKWNDYYVTKGTAFDQQMVYENFSKTIELSKELGTQDSFLKTIENILPKLDPVIIGKSGQVKEYREEEYYGDIGEKNHRHISQLVGLYPGSLISKNDKWLKASQVTLNLRGDKSTGWATAHRLCLWTRTKNVKRSMDLVKSFIINNVLNNLWDSHPPFQIDGNFGYVAGINEMFLQSHNGYIELLPCLPKKWGKGSIKGLKSRGGFAIDMEFSKNNFKATIKSECGQRLRLLNKGYSYRINQEKFLDSTEEYINIDTNIGDVIEVVR